MREVQIRRRQPVLGERAFERRAKARQPVDDDGAEERARLGLELPGLRVIARLTGRGRAGEQARDEFELQRHVVRQVVERLGAFQPAAPIPALDGLHAAAHHGAVQIAAGIERDRRRRGEKQLAVELQQRERPRQRVERGAQLRERFIDPLGLADTYYQAVERPRGPTSHGYRFSGAGRTLPPIDLSDGTTVVPFTSVVTAAGAAGSIATSAGDLARWAQALYGGTVLGPEMREAMLAHVLRTTAYEPSSGYGLGVQVVTIDGHATLGHSGRLLGFSAVMRWLPDEGVAIAVLTNQSRTDPNVVLRALLRIGLQQPSDCATCPIRR